MSRTPIYPQHIRISCNTSTERRGRKPGAVALHTQRHSKSLQSSRGLLCYSKCQGATTRAINHPDQRDSLSMPTANRHACLSRSNGTGGAEPTSCWTTSLSPPIFRGLIWIMPSHIFFFPFFSGTSHFSSCNSGSHPSKAVHTSVSHSFSDSHPWFQSPALPQSLNIRVVLANKV